jgi:Icc-related predicted phosphoesterase
MKIQVMSDLHFEFHADSGKSFIASMSPVGYDALILAGDITIHHLLLLTLTTICEKYQGIPVFYVCGNHEFYHSSIEAIRDVVSKIGVPNFHFLDNSVVTHQGVRFVGTTLWFERNAFTHPVERQLSDFHYIQNFKEDVIVEHEKAKKFLTDTVREGDVVITHHAPLWQSVNPKYAGSPINCFFVSDMEELITSANPKVWVHGHMHDSSLYSFNQTAIICNPFGYMQREENPNWDSSLLLTV